MAPNNPDRPPRPPAPLAAPDVAALAERLEALAKKATPGPWNATTWPEGAFMITAGETVDPDSGVVLCQRQDWNHNAEESRANGQLIGDLVNNLPTILAALRSAPDGWTAGFAAGIEAAAQECEPLGDPPCDCAYETTCNGEPCWIYDCHCSNSGDLTRIASWCSDKSRAAAIRALPLPPPPAKEPRAEGGNHG